MRSNRIGPITTISLKIFRIFLQKERVIVGFCWREVSFLQTQMLGADKQLLFTLLFAV